jgi:hypothetical protein
MSISSCGEATGEATGEAIDEAEGETILFALDLAGVLAFGDEAIYLFD